MNIHRLVEMVKSSPIVSGGRFPYRYVEVPEIMARSISVEELDRVLLENDLCLQEDVDPMSSRLYAVDMFPDMYEPDME